MAGNSTGILFRVTTWGESHGRALGAVVEGCPPGLELEERDIQTDLDRRRPGRNAQTSPRRSEAATSVGPCCTTNLTMWP